VVTSRTSRIDRKRIVRAVGLMLPAAGWFVLLGLLFFGSCGWIVGIGLDVWNSKRERETLLNHSDHGAIPAACRDLMRKYPGEEIDGQDPRLPAILRELGTSYVSVSEGAVHVELHGGFDHYGVSAFAEGVEGGGDRKLIEGLWYCTE